MGSFNVIEGSEKRISDVLRELDESAPLGTVGGRGDAEELGFHLSDELVRGAQSFSTLRADQTKALLEDWIGSLGLDGVARKLDDVMSGLELCLCLPAEYREGPDRTLRESAPPKILECKVVPPPAPKRRDPFICKVEVPPYHEVLLVNTSDINPATGEFVVVGTVKNKGGTTATFEVPDTSGRMPQANDCVIAFARQYTDQLDDKGHNIAGPWSRGVEAYVDAPRGAGGNILPGYKQDMRPPYVRKDHIRMRAEGCLSQPGKRIFYSDAPRTIARDTTVNVYADVSKTEGVEDWKLVGTTKTKPNGTFVCVVGDSLIGGVDGFKMELVQPDQNVQFDPIIHQPFGTDYKKACYSLINDLFNRVPTAIELTIGAPRLCSVGAQFTLEAGRDVEEGQCVKIINRSSSSRGEQIFEAGPGGAVNVDMMGAKDGDQLEAYVQREIDGKNAWLCLGSWSLGCTPIKFRSEVLRFDIGPDAGLKPGQRVRITDRTTGKTHTFVAVHAGEGRGAVHVVMPNVSRGDLLKFDYEEVVNNKKTWIGMFEWQLDANEHKLRGHEKRETHFTSTVYDGRSGLTEHEQVKRMLGLAKYFAIGNGKDIPADERKAYLLGTCASFYGDGNIPLIEWGFSGPEEQMKWFLLGFEACRDKHNKDVFYNAGVEAVDEKDSGFYENGRAKMLHYSSSSGSLGYPPRTKSYVLAENEFGIKSKEVATPEYKRWQGW